MDENYVRVPALLVSVTEREVIVVALVAGVIATVAYQIGKERQRRWMTNLVKNSLSQLKK